MKILKALTYIKYRLMEDMIYLLGFTPKDVYGEDISARELTEEEWG